MKHCYTFLLTLVMAVFALTGNARTLSITLEPGSHAELQNYSGDVVFTLQEGVNSVDDGNAALFVVPTNGHSLEYVRDENGKAVAPQNNKNGSYPSLYFLYNSSTVYTVKTVAPTFEAYTITVDDPSKVKVYYLPSGAIINLVAGTNQLNYDPLSDNRIVVQRSATNESSLYSVKVNGADAPKKWGQYETIYLKPDMVIDILANHPAEELEYTLLYSDETDFWTNILVDNQPVTITDNKFKANAGSVIKLYNANGDRWYINKITYPDGKENSGGYLGKPYYEWNPTGWYEMVATVGGNIVVDAHHLRNYDVTFNLTGASFMSINVGSDNVDGTPLTGLKEGENKITLGEKDTRIRIFPVGDAIFSKATYIGTTGDEEIDIPYTEELGCYSIVQGKIGFGAVVNIVAKEKYDVTNVTLDIDDPSNVFTYLRYPVNGSTLSAILLEQELTAGMNTVGVPENRDGLYFRPFNEDCTIESVTYQAPGKEEAAAEKDDATGVFYVLNPEEGSKITVKTSHTPYESSILVYLDDAAKAAAPVSVNSPGGRKITLNTGYNRIGFNAEDNEGYYGDGFVFLMPTHYGYFTAYYNGELVDDVDTAENTRRFTRVLQDGDIVKIYTAVAEPAAHDVKFEIKGEATVANLTTDLATAVEGLEFNALQGTLVSFDVEVPEGYEYKIRFNRLDFLPVEGTENHYEFNMPATIPGQYVLINIDSTKKDEPVTDGVKFTLTPGSKASLYVGEGSNLLPVKELAEGENVLDINFNSLYYIVPADRYRLVSVVTAEGQEVELFEDEAYFKTNGALLNNKPSDAYTVTTEDMSGILTIEAANGSAAVYFDLQGRRVDTLRPGLYIRRTGAATEKVIIR